jgi:hypothetical protein
VISDPNGSGTLLTGFHAEIWPGGDFHDNPPPGYWADVDDAEQPLLRRSRVLYPTLVGLGSDPSTLGDSFYIYYSHNGEYVRRLG